MNALIYYPGFEIEDENWLKFALIYLDHVRPIIPESGLCQLSDKTKHIMNTTDLIEPYIPQYQEGENASINALEQFEAYLKNPERYLSSHGFFKQFTETSQKVRARNYIQNWKDKRNQDFVLYSEKYSYSFSSYCVDEGLAHHTRHGLSMPRELAYVI